MTEIKNIHHWKVLTLSCIDGRFIQKVDNWVKKHESVFDYRTEVGASKAIIDSESDRKRFFNVIKTSISLHKIKEVWLFDHIDCGAYGGSKTFENAEAEKEFHSKRMTKAAEIISEKFPEIKVKKFFVGWEKIEEIE